MKKAYSTILMLAMMAATLSFTACGGDDEDGNNGGDISTLNYLEVTINGKTYTQRYNLPFIAVTLPSDVDGSLWLSSSIEESFNGDLDFAIAIFHNSNIDAFRSSNTSTYNVIGNKMSVWQQASDIHNLTLQINYRNGNGNCEVTDGTHKVSTIKKKDNDVVIISGSFSASLKDDKFTYEVSGKYQVIVGLYGYYERLSNVMKGINHRGFNTIAPENTLPAYILSAKKGFKYVEADVCFTSDGVPVLLHDKTINRTARNADGTPISHTININTITFAAVREYDFGIWKSSDYAGTQIPSLEEFLVLCRNIGLHPYIELKENGSYTKQQIESVVSLVKANGMNGKVTFISFNATYLGYVKTADPFARLGYLTFSKKSGVSTIPTDIQTAIELRTGYNEVFLNAYDYYLPSDAVALCKAAAMPLELWCPNTKERILGYDKYVSGVTSDSINAEFVKNEQIIG